MKSPIRILLIVALALVPLQAAAPAQAAKKMEILLQDDGIFLFTQPYYDRDYAFLQARALGVRGLRVNVQWFDAMPESQWRPATKPANITYDWSKWDNLIARARQFGIHVQLALVGDPPTWACGNKRVPYACDGYKPNRRHFRAFAKAAAAHFRGRVKRYSIWNEPNWYTWLSPHKKSPLLYRKLYQAGYKGVKDGYPRAKVLIGEFAPRFQKNVAIAPLEFMRRMVCLNNRFKFKNKRRCKGGPLKFNGLAHHPYHFEVGPGKESPNKDDLTIANLDALNRHLKKFRRKGVIKSKPRKTQIFLTEHGWMVTGNSAVRPQRRIPESKRKRWIVKAFKIAQRTPNVKGMLYYNFISPPLGSPSSFFDMGLIQTNGTPRASYFALQNWIQEAIRDGRALGPRPCSVC